MLLLLFLLCIIFTIKDNIVNNTPTTSTRSLKSLNEYLETIKFDKDWKCDDEVLTMVNLAEKSNQECRGGHSSDQTNLNSEFMFFICALVGSRMNTSLKPEPLYQRCYTEFLGYIGSDNYYIHHIIIIYTPHYYYYYYIFNYIILNS